MGLIRMGPGFLALLGVASLSAQVSPSITAVINGTTGTNQLSPGVYAVIVGSGFSGLTAVTVGGQNAYISESASTEALVQFPYNVQPGTANVVVTASGAQSTAFPITLAATSPGIQQGSLLHSSLQAVTPTNPASPGETIIVLATGLGPTNPPSAAGLATSAIPLATVPAVTVNGEASQVLTATLFANYPLAGFDQVTFVVPADASPGTLSVVVSSGGNSSPFATLPVAAHHYRIETIAGQRAPDNVSPTSTFLLSPQGLTFDPSGNLYLAETNGHKVRKISSGIITTYAGTGVPADSGAGGPAVSAGIGTSRYVASDSQGNIFVLDSEGSCSVDRIDASTHVLTVYAGIPGTCGFSGNGGPATSATLGQPGSILRGIALDSGGNLFIADNPNHVVRRVDASTHIITTYAGNGNTGVSGDNGAAISAAIGSPVALAFDAGGNLYIGGSNRIRKINHTTGIITTVAGPGNGNFTPDGSIATSTTVGNVRSLAFDANGDLFYSDSAYLRVRRIDAASQIVTTVAGNGVSAYSGDGGLAVNASLVGNEGIALDAGGNLYISDFSANVVRKVTNPGATGTISTFAGSAGPDNVSATSAFLGNPSAVASDSAGDLFIADTAFGRIRKATGSPNLANLATIAGLGYAGYGGDGGAAINALLTDPDSVAIDPTGIIYIADSGNCVIRKIDLTGKIAVFAGKANSCLSGTPAAGGATSVSIGFPTAVAVDSTGSNVFIGDRSAAVIWKVSNGNLSIFAGTGTAGYTGDGGLATAAQVNVPSQLVIDSSNNLWFADSGANVIREITASDGKIHTVAGTGTAGYSGDGGPATAALLNGPSGIALDSSKNLLIGDSNNNVIRFVSASTGLIETVAGSTAGFGGDGSPAGLALLDGPSGLAFDNLGRLLVADSFNDVIRRLTPQNYLSTLANPPQGGLISGGGLYDVGTQASVTATPNPGYTFATFTGGVTGSSPEASVTMNGPVSVTANFSACTFTFTPASASPGSAGGTTSVSFTVTPSNCAWSASSDSSWLTLNGTTSGTGNGTVNYSVAANSGAARNGNIVFGSADFAVNQGAGGSPTITTNSNLGTLHLGTQTVQLTANGGNGTYAWSLTSGTLPPGLALRTDVPTYFPSNAQAGLIGVATTPGTYNFTLSVSSGGVANSQAFTMKVSALDLQDATPPDAFIGNQFSYTFTPIANAGTVTFSVNSNSTNGAMPPGLTLSSSGVLSGTPTSAGNYVIAMNISDGVDNQYEQYNLSVYAVQITTPGLIVTTPPATQFSSYATTLAASGGSGTGYTWTMISGSLPTGLSLSSGGTISGTITSGPGLYAFSVKVTDSGGNSTSKNMGLDVIGSPITPMRITGFPYRDPVLGNHTGIVAGVCCGGTAPFTWTVTGLPPGLATEANSNSFLNYPATPGDLQIYGVPQQPGTFNVTFKVTDATGANTSVTVPMHVSVLDVALPSNYGAYSLPNGTINTLYTTQTFRVLGGTGPYSFTQTPYGELPDGLSINSGALTVSGTPIENGSFSPSFVFSDSAGNTLFRYEGIQISGGASSTTTINGNGVYSYQLASAPIGAHYSTQFSACCLSSYTWSVVSGSTLPPGLTLSSSGQLSGTPTTAGTYSFLIQAANSSNVGVKNFVLKITPIAITTLGLIYGDVGVAYNASLAVTGATGTVTWTQPLSGSFALPPGLTLNANGTITGTPTSAGAYVIDVLATDGSGNTATNTFTINIYQSGAPPINLGNTFSLGTWHLGTDTIQLAASGGNGRFTWSLVSGTLPPGLALRTDVPTYFSANAQAGLIGVATTPGNYSFTLNVTSAGQSASRTYTVRISALDLQDATPPDGFIGNSYSYTFTPIAQANGSTVTFAVNSNSTNGAMPPGLTLSSSGTLSGTPTTAGTYYIAMNISDGVDTQYEQYTMYIYTVDITTAGLLTSNATQNQPYTASLAASGGSGGYTWTIVDGSLPGGLTLSSNGTISGVVNASPGLYGFAVTVTDSTGHSTSKKIGLDVVGAAAAPIWINNTQFDDPVLGDHYEEFASLCCGGTAPFTWTVTGLPPGLTTSFGLNSFEYSEMTPGKLEIYGVPQQAGNFNVTFKVTDATGASTTAIIPIHVSVLDVALPNAYGTYGIPDGTIGVPYPTQTFRVLGGSGPYSFTMVPYTGVYPYGFVANPTALTVSGTPLESGNLGPELQFSDSNGNSLVRYEGLTINGGSSTITVNGNGMYDYLLLSTPLNAPYSFQFSACCVSSYTWSVAGGSSLPPGLTLSSSGLLSGTPTTSGNYTFLIQAADATNPSNVGTKSFVLQVTPITISTTSLPYGDVGVPYSASLTATGGSGTLTWSLPILGATILPPGLTLSSNGTISGTPTSAGLYLIGPVVTDGSGNTSLEPLYLTIYQSGGPPLSLNLGTNLGSYAPGPNQQQIQLGATGGTPPYHYSITPGTPAINGLRVQDGQPLPGFFSATGGTGALLGLLGPGSYSTSIRVTDSTNATFDQPINFVVSSIDIVNFNTLPFALVNTPFSYQFVPYGGIQSPNWTATGLPPGMTLNSSTGVLSGTPTSAGTFSMAVSLSDSQSGQFVSRSEKLYVSAFAITDNTTLPAATAQSTYSHQFSAPNCGSNCTWTLFVGSLPAGLTLSSSGVLSGATTSANATESAFNLQATGSNGTAYQVFSLPVVSTAAQALAVATAFSTVRPLGVSTAQPLSAIGGTPPYVFSVISGSLPPGLSLTNSAQSVSAGDFAPFSFIAGWPEVAGTYNFTLQVTDSSSQGNSATQAVSMTISTLDLLYTALPVSSLTVNNPIAYNQPYTQPLLAVGGNGNYTWTVVGGGQTVYPGLTLNPSTGVVSGTPTNDGPQNTPITIADSNGASITTNLGINVPLIAQSPQTITFNSLPNVNLGSGTVTLNATASSGLAVTYASNSTGVCTVNGNAVTLVAGGTCSITASQPGNPAFTAAAPVTRTFTVIPPTVTSATLPGDAVGSAYSYTFAATGGTAPYGGWTVSAGSLPPGLTLNASTGVISGTPTSAGEGPFNFSVTVTDHAGDVSAAQSFSIAIQAQPVTISGLNPASATAGGPAFTLTVTGAHFVPGCTVNWNGTPIAGSSVVSPTQMTATVASSLIAAASMDTVTVACGEVVTSGITFNVVAGTGQVWTQIMPSGNLPAARYGQTAVFDSAAQQMIVFGGSDGEAPLNDVQSLSTGTSPAWTSVRTAGDSPEARYGHTAVYDSTNSIMTIFGGTVGDGVCTNDVWTLSNATGAGGTPAWTPLGTGGEPPSGRAFHNSVYDPTSNNMIVFGGSCGEATFNDVWILTHANGLGGTPTWTQLSPTGTPPSVRYGASLVYDSTSNELILFGGGTSSTSVNNDLWILSHANGSGGTPVWTPVTPSGGPPMARAGHTATYSSSANSMTIYGGDNAGTDLSDIWLLTTANGVNGTPTWTQLAPAGGAGLPPARANHTSVFDTTNNRMIIFGGDGTLMNDSWALSHANSIVMVNPAVLPAGQVGVSYSATLSASGGTPPYGNWTISSGTFPQGLTLNSSTGAITGAPLSLSGSPFSFSVTVTDSAGNVSPPQTFSISVTNPLLISTPSLPGGLVGQTYAPVLLKATGGSGNYAWFAAGLPAGMSVSSAGVLGGTPGSAGNYSVFISVVDTTTGLSTTNTFSLLVSSSFSVSTTSLPNGGVGAIYGPVTMAASGGSGTYSWTVSGAPSGVTMSTAGVLTSSAVLTAPAAGSYTVLTTVTDTVTSLTASNTYSITIYPALSVTTKSLPNGTVGTAYGPVTVSATGGSGNYSWSVSGAPPGVAITIAGVLASNSGLANAAAGSYSVVATVTDTASGVTASATFPVTVSGALSVTTSALPNGFVGSTYGPVTMAASGGSGNYSWSVTGAPSGVTMTTAGVLSSSAPLASSAAGTYSSVVVTVTDTNTSVTATRTYAITIAFGQITISGSSSLGVFAPNGAISATYSATGGEGPYTWSAPQGLPTGLSINAATGALTGSIAAPGNYSFQIKVSDSQTPSATSSINVSLSVLGILTTALPSGTVNVSYLQTLATFGGSSSCVWSVTSGALPAGLALSTAGVVSGTPTATGTVPPGGITSAFTVSASCGGVTVSQALSITITAAPQSLSIPGGSIGTPVSLSNGIVATPYGGTLQAVHGQPPYAWKVIGGNLPTGLSLNSSGGISGTPTTPGPYAFTGQVTDTSGAVISSAFSLTIAPLTVNLNTGPLPNGIVGSNYPTQLTTAAGGVPPYTFTVTSANSGTLLPGGLTFANGQITGTPTNAGVANFTVTASDSSTPPLTATGTFDISVEPAHADLILSQASASFALNSGAKGLPTGASITVQSSVVQQQLNYTVSVMPTVSWLDVTGGGATPGGVGINLDSSALSLSPGVRQTSVVVTCVAPSPCAGNSQNITVTLNVAAPPPQLTLSTSLLSFSAQNSSTASISQTLGVQNTGGGTITVNSITSASSFVTLSGIPASIPAGPAIPVTVTVNPAGLVAGYYQGTIVVDTSAGSVNLPLDFLLTQSPIMTLNPSGSQFQTSAGSLPGNANGSFLVSVTGSSIVNWTATLQPGANWLTLNSTTGSSTASNPGTVGFTINSNATSLTPQAYYALIEVTSGQVANSPQSYVVVLNVSAANVVVPPNPQPAGLVFIANGSTLAAQTVKVFAGSATPLNYQASSDSPWLLVSPATGTTSSASPASSSVSVSLSGLAAGVYRGNVSYAFSAAAVRTVNVTLIVTPAAASASARTMTALPRATCAPSQLVATQTGLVNNFSQPTSWPTALAVLLFDDCGNLVNNAQVVATFNNGDPPLALSLASLTSGTYAGTWTPRNSASQVTISATAAAPGFTASTVQINGQVTPNAAPILNKNGTLNAFAIAAAPGAPIAPGTIVQIYGANLASQATPASTIPLPTSLNQTQVLIGGLYAPLYYVSPGQINAQVPFELTAGQAYQIIVNANGALSTPNPIQLSAAAPGIAQFAAGEIIAQHSDGSLVLETSPAAPGEYLVMYVAGMGNTTQNVPSGTASPSTTLASSLEAPTLTLNGTPVTNIIFAGLTPTLVGLYQINFQVPANAPNGDLQLVLSQSDGPSSSTVLPVQR